MILYNHKEIKKVGNKMKLSTKNYNDMVNNKASDNFIKKLEKEISDEQGKAKERVLDYNNVARLVKEFDEKMKPLISKKDMEGMTFIIDENYGQSYRGGFKNTRMLSTYIILSKTETSWNISFQRDKVQKDFIEIFIASDRQKKIMYENAMKMLLSER